VLAELKSGETGLTQVEVAARLVAHGPNRLPTRSQAGPLLLFLRQFANPLVYILIGAAVIKFMVKGPLDALIIGAILLFMAIMGFVQERRAQKAMAALLQLSVPKARVRRDGQVSVIPAEELVPGDVLLLDAGDRVAADARLRELSNLRINESPFTGESLPVEKALSPVPADTPVSERRNMVFMGTTVSAGRGVAVVTGTGMHTEIGRIAAAIQEIAPEKTPLQASIDRLGKALIVVVLAVCCLLGAVALLQGHPWVDVLLLTVAAAVSGIPEGLPAAVTVVLAISVARMAQRNVIIRKLAAVETLGAATIICSDKTGTLTLNQMTVRCIVAGGRRIEAEGTGYAPQGRFLEEGQPLPPGSLPSLQVLLRAAALCNDAILSRDGEKWDILGDPTEGALLTAAGKAGLFKDRLEAEAPRLADIPFESERQYMVTLHADGGQRRAYVKGSVEKMLQLCGHCMDGAGAVGPLDEAGRRGVQEMNGLLAAQALRVLALGYADYPLEYGRLDADRLRGRVVLAGLCGMIDPPREDAREAVLQCRQAGIQVAMITGDSPLTARAIASQLGIGSGREPMTGREVAALSEADLVAGLGDCAVFARIEPLHKLKLVNAFKRAGHVVAMTGDGVNDAPALEAASIGVSMGITGTDVAKEASDMVLTDDRFASIVAAVEEGRAIFQRLRNITLFLLMTCFAELGTLLLCVGLFGKAPLEPIHILWINLVTGALVAIPLGLEPKSGDELRHPPRSSKVGLIYRGMVWRMLFLALFMALGVSFLHHYATVRWHDEAVAHTMAFCAIVVFEWLVAFNVRSDTAPLWRLGLLRNRPLLGCMLLGLSLQAAVVYVPPLERFFGTHSLSIEQWALVLLPALLVTVLESLRKLVAPSLFEAGKWRP
jgi:Ca2+-transporting ATPase